MKNEGRSLLLLFKFGNLIHNFNKKSEKEIGVSLAQWSVLKQLIDMPGTSALKLAHSVGVHPSTLSQTLKRLEKKNFLYLLEDPKDSRKKLISITKVGKTALESFEENIRPLSKKFSSIEKDIDNLSHFLENNEAF